MFRCKECGTEYEEKPDYCDCGNDTFEEIKPAPAPEPKPAPAQAEPISPKPASTPQIRTVRQEYNTPFNKPNSEIPKVESSADIVSLGLFILSIILAFCTLFIFGNPKEQPTQQPEQNKTAQTTPVNIPNVDAYWDNSAVEIPKAETVVQENQDLVQPVKKEVDPITSKFDEWLNRPKRVVDDSPKYTQPVQQTAKPVQYQTKTTQPAKTQTQAKTNTATKPISTNNAKINSPGAPNDLLQRVQNSIQFTNTQTTKSTTPARTQTQSSTTASTSTGRKTDPFKIDIMSPKATTTTPKTATTTTAQTPPTLRNATQQNVKSQAEINREIANYKASLRNNIGKKINFANVIGDGSCAITFKVDSSGKLINRNFVTKSSNITLNDAVYSAMMSTPSYNPPPEGYKSETMTLKVKMYDGNYEITLN